MLITFFKIFTNFLKVFYSLYNTLKIWILHFSFRRDLVIFHFLHGQKWKILTFSIQQKWLFLKNKWFPSYVKCQIFSFWSNWNTSKSSKIFIKKMQYMYLSGALEIRSPRILPLFIANYCWEPQSFSTLPQLCLWYLNERLIYLIVCA